MQLFAQILHMILPPHDKKGVQHRPLTLIQYVQAALHSRQPCPHIFSIPLQPLPPVEQFVKSICRFLRYDAPVFAYIRRSRRFQPVFRLSDSGVQAFNALFSVPVQI